MNVLYECDGMNVIENIKINQRVHGIIFMPSNLSKSNGRLALRRWKKKLETESTV
jgi:hypothetical protein